MKIKGPVIAAIVVDLLAYAAIQLFLPSVQDWLKQCDPVPRSVGGPRCGRPNSLIFFVPFAVAAGVIWWRWQRAIR